MLHHNGLPLDEFDGMPALTAEEIRAERYAQKDWEDLKEEKRLLEFRNMVADSEFSIAKADRELAKENAEVGRLVAKHERALAALCRKHTAARAKRKAKAELAAEAMGRYVLHLQGHSL